MSTCEQCDTPVGGEELFVCTYCDHVHCTEHRVPETHDCIFRPFLRPPWRGKLDEATKYQPSVGRTAAASTDSNRPRRPGTDRQARTTGTTRPSEKSGRQAELTNPSPDVTPFGDIDGQETAPFTAAGPSRWAQWRRWLRLQLRTPVYTLWRLAVLVVAVGIGVLAVRLRLG